MKENNLNFFERIGKQRREDKKNREKKIEDYWKLSSMERQEFDLKYNQINDVIPHGIIKGYFKVFFYVAGIFLALHFFSPVEVSFLEVGFKILALYLSFMPLVLLAFFVCIIINAMLSDKKIKNLEKGFGIVK